MSEQSLLLPPLDWRPSTLRQVSECILGGTPSTEVPQLWNGDIPWMASGDVHLRRVRDVPGRITAQGLRSSNATLTPPPAVAVGLAGQGKTRGTVALTLCTVSTNQSIALLKSNGSDLRTDYLFHNLDWRYEELRARSSGGGRGGLSKAILEAVPIDLPPLSEQQKIAQVLDTLDTAILETEVIISKLKVIKQGLLHDLLTRGINADGELRPPQTEAPYLYKESPLGWIPKEWEVKAVSELADVRSGATPSRALASRYFDALGVPWVKTLDLNEDVICETDERITAAALQETSCSLLPEGTVLVAMYGGWEQIGRTALLAVPAATNQAISSLIFRSSNTVPEFLLRALQHGRPRWHGVAASTRKDPNITKADVLAFEVPVPIPDEQTEIARRMRSCLDRLKFENSMLVKFRHQKVGLMDDLLTGRVRVTPLLTEAAEQGSD